MTKKTTREFGQEQEQRACDYLTEQGLTLETKNYLCKMGEIDLIMHDQDYLVFVEVRYRNNPNYGGALASVDKTKQRKIIKTATNYLQQQKLFDKVPCRFDVVAIDDTAHKKGPTIEWIKDAFWVQY